MRTLVGLAVPFLAALFVIEVASEALYLRAMGYQPVHGRTTRDRGPTDPVLPVHEVDREASAGAIIT